MSKLIKKLEKWLKEAGVCIDCLNHTCRLFLVLFLCFQGVGLAHSVDMDAIQQIETGGEADPDQAVGASGEIGRYQISPIVLKHYNQVTKYWLPKEKLSEPATNKEIANWYMNWLFDRCYTVKDTIIAWNWGIGNWREWKNKIYPDYVEFNSVGLVKFNYTREAEDKLPKVTQDYLKKYEKITGEVL